jgi:hypothetical protein
MTCVENLFVSLKTELISAFFIPDNAGTKPGLSGFHPKNRRFFPPKQVFAAFLSLNLRFFSQPARYGVILRQIKLKQL